MKIIETSLTSLLNLKPIAIAYSLSNSKFKLAILMKSGKIKKVLLSRAILEKSNTALYCLKTL